MSRQYIHLLFGSILELLPNVGEMLAGSSVGKIDIPGLFNFKERILSDVKAGEWLRSKQQI